MTFFKKWFSCQAILNFCVKHKNAFISETVPDRAILTNFFTHRGSDLKNVEFPEFWRKLKMSFISKNVRNRVILNNVCTLWVLETLDIVPVKKVEFPEFCPPS